MVIYDVKFTSQSVSSQTESVAQKHHFSAGCKHRAKEAFFFLSPQFLYDLLRKANPLESGLKSKDLNIGAGCSTLRGQQGQRQRLWPITKKKKGEAEGAAREVNKEVMHAG